MTSIATGGDSMAHDRPTSDTIDDSKKNPSARFASKTDDEAELRKTGIEIVGDVPWGTHFCQFYETRQDLVEMLVPYFAAGLWANEFCMWVTSEPLDVDEAAEALRKYVPDLDDYLRSGQMEILPYDQWYKIDGVIDGQRIMNGWINKLNSALAKGLEGLRLSGNTFWLEQDNWSDFRAYEEAVNTTIGAYRMIAACTYSIDKCGAGEVADVVSNHEYALMKRDGKWIRVESSSFKQAELALQQLNRTLKAHIDSSRAMMHAKDETSYLNEVCKIVVKYCGHKMVWIGYVQNDEGKSVVPVADSGFDHNYLQSLNITWADTTRGQGPCGVAIRTGKPDVCRNLLEDPRFEPWREAAKVRGYSSSIALPLFVDGKVIGVMSINSRAPYAFTDGEIELLSNLSEDLGYGVSAIRLREERARTAKERELLLESLAQSERRYKFLTGNMLDVVWILDAESSCLRYISQSVERLCGYTVEEALRLPLQQLMRSETTESLKTIIEQRAQTLLANASDQTYYTDYMHLICRDRSVIIMEAVTRYYVNELTGAVEVLGVSRDVTQRRRAEYAAQEAREESQCRAAQLESFISSIYDGVVLFDGDFNILMANEAFNKLIGIHSDKVVGAKLTEWGIFTLDGDPVAVEDYPSRRALQGVETNSERYKIVSAWGEVAVSISGSPVRDGRGKILGGTLSLHDIADQLEYERRREEIYKREHHIADMLQQALIPPHVPAKIGNFSIGVRYQPALREAEVGGDFYDVFDLGNNKIGVLIGDVAGKGLAAAIRVAAARYAIRSYAVIESSPARVLNRANQALCMDMDMDNEAGMLTAFFAVIDTATGEIHYASAGHEPPLLCHSTGEIEELPVGGLPLGVWDMSEYDQGEVQLSENDTIVLVTDGITEARAGIDRFFEKKGMIQFLESSKTLSPDETASGLLEAAISHSGGELQDDAAVVVVCLDACRNIESINHK